VRAAAADERRPCSRALGLTQSEEQPLPGRDRLDPVHHLLTGCRATAVLRPEVLGDRLVGRPRRGGIELEGPVDDLDVVAVARPVQGTLEATLADVAPRAHDVRPDLDPHVRHNGT